MTSNRSDWRTDSPRDVAWCCQEHFKLNPSIFTDFHRYLPLYPTRYQAESPALNWNYETRGDMALWQFPTRYGIRNCVMAALHQATYLPLLQEESQGILPRLESNYGQALPLGPGWKRARLPDAVQRSFSIICWTYLLLWKPEVLEWYSMPRFLKHLLKGDTDYFSRALN